MTRIVARRRFPGGTPPAFEPPIGPVALWRSAAFAPTSLTGSGDERLRVFQAHYGEDVLGLAREGDSAGVRAAMDRWIASNPPRADDAWHPYTTSTRVGNWIASLALVSAAHTSEVESSLWGQLRHVALNVEDDVLGNHVIRNARALVLGGLAFGDAALLDQGVGLLERELPEQVLPDGGHYERSPAYHLVVLRDLLEIRAAVADVIPAGVVDRMLAFGAALARPDGVPALFNDGNSDLAPVLELPAAAEGLTLFPDTGYAVVRSGALWLAFDCGPFAPPFLPAHAHADALSFQLWWEGRPVVVDPATSTYEPGLVRMRERGTPAHATVSVDGRDQFEPWGAFRSGPFPSVELISATPAELVARVALGSRVAHTRAVALEGHEVVVADEISGGEQIRSCLPLDNDDLASIAALGPLAPRREEHARAERFFELRRGTALVLEGSVRAATSVGWRISCVDGRG